VSQLATTSYKDRDVASLAVDTDEQLRALVNMSKVTAVQQYTEPMFVTLDAEPFAIVAARIRLRDTPETVVANGLRVSFTWLGDRARIDEIEGMTVGASFYTFDFLVVI
jgi:hypothetical protein